MKVSAGKVKLNLFGGRHINPGSGSGDGGMTSSGKGVSDVVAAAVLAAVVLGQRLEVAPLAWIHIGFRCAHLLCYTLNLPNFRSLAFVGGFDNIALIFLEALKGTS